MMKLKVKLCQIFEDIFRPIIGCRSAVLNRNNSAKTDKSTIANQKHLHMIYHTSCYLKQRLA